MDETFVKIDDIEIDKIDDDKPNNDNPVTKIVSQNDYSKYDKLDQIDKAHNGESITKLKVSPKEKYLVTYSQKDRSFVGWNIENIDEGTLKLEKTFKLNDINEETNFILRSMCVSDDKKLVYISKNGTLGKL
jgi:hypothetical protein